MSSDSMGLIKCLLDIFADVPAIILFSNKLLKRIDREEIYQVVTATEVI